MKTIIINNTDIDLFDEQMRIKIESALYKGMDFRGGIFVRMNSGKKESRYVCISASFTEPDYLTVKINDFTHEE